MRQEQKEQPWIAGNLLEGLPKGSLPEEWTDILLEAQGVRVERIVSAGHCSPEGFWYEPVVNEWVMVLQGEGELGFDDGSRLRLVPGAHCFLPAGCRHRVESTSLTPPCVWLAVFWDARPGADVSGS